MQLFNIDKFLLEDIQSPDHPSEFETAEKYDILILRLPEFDHESLKINSEAFLIDHDKTYIYDREKKDFVMMGSYQDFSDFLDDKLDILIKNLQKYHIDIELLEENLLENDLKSNFMQTWLTYKKDMSLISRLTFHALLAFELFINHQKKRHKTENFSYNDNLEHINRIQNLAKSSLEKLDNLYNFYRAKVDERMNKNMYILTIISGIFMPLTLITGFFGMNTGGLPFLNDPDGTLKVVFISLGIELLFLVPFLLLNSQRQRLKK